MKRMRRSVSTALAFLLCAVCVVPFLYVFLASLRGADGEFTAYYYYQVFLAQSRYLFRFWKSLGLCLCIAAGQVVVSVPAAYGFAKYRFPGRNALFFLLMILMILPLQVTLVPNYIILEKAGLLNTYASLALPAIILPLGAFILTHSFRALSNSVIEAARLDGCSLPGLLLRVVLPMSKNALICVFLLAFLLVCASAWMLRLSTGREGLERALTHVDLAELRVDPFFEDVDEPTTASELLSEELAPVGLKLDRKTTARLLNSEPVRDFLADQLAPLCDDVYRGRTRYEYEPKELEELLTGSRLRRVMKEEGVFLSTEEAAGVSKLLADYGLGELLNRDTLREQEPDLVRAMYLGLSWVALGVLAALTLLLAVLVAVTDRGRAPYFLRDLGGTAAVGGGLLSLAALLAGILPRLWVKICGGEALAAVVSRAVLLSHLGFCLGLLALGVLMLLHSRFLRRRES